MLYEDIDCGGRSLVIKPSMTRITSLVTFGFNDITSSVGPCNGTQAEVITRRYPESVEDGFDFSSQEWLDLRNRIHATTESSIDESIREVFNRAVDGQSVFDASPPNDTTDDLVTLYYHVNFTGKSLMSSLANSNAIY